TRSTRRGSSLRLCWACRSFRSAPLRRPRSDHRGAHFVSRHHAASSDESSRTVFSRPLSSVRSRLFDGETSRRMSRIPKRSTPASPSAAACEVASLFALPRGSLSGYRGRPALGPRGTHPAVWAASPSGWFLGHAQATHHRKEAAMVKLRSALALASLVLLTSGLRQAPAAVPAS